jgi:hypothetical protein
MARTRLLIRLEPLDGTDLQGALAAGTWDALWTLARQDALGELLGTFGGAPVASAARGTIRPLTHYRPADPPAGWPDPGDAQTATLTGEVPPPAILAQAEPVRSGTGWTLRARAAAGVQLADELEAAGVPHPMPTLATAYPITERPVEDPAGRAFLHVVAGRLPDGEALYADLTPLAHGSDPNWPLPARLATLEPVAADVRSAVRQWVTWLDATVQEPVTEPSWSAEALEHRFAVAAASSDPSLGTEVLRVAGQRDDLDWYSFDVAARGPHTPTGADPQPFGTPALLPTALRFPGMPTPRWWEMDDAATDLGAVDASAADLARLLVLEYALVFGNDMFVIPLRVPVDTLTAVDGLVVQDTFGVSTEIAPAFGTGTPLWAAWRMFTLTDTSAGSPSGRPSLLLVSRLASPVIGDPVDDGQFVRDEMANAAWLIQSLYEGEDGFPVRRADSAVSDVAPPRPAPPDTALQWTLSVTPAAHWIPYAPRSRADGSVSLVRAEGYPARGRLLSAAAASLPDRVVSREGVRLLREFVHARDSAGKPFVWARWRRQVGRGETSSGLAFDVVRPPESP